MFIQNLEVVPKYRDSRSAVSAVYAVLLIDDVVDHPITAPLKQLYEIRRFRLQGPPWRARSGIRSFLGLQVREHLIEVEIELGGVGLPPCVDLLNDFIRRLPGQIP